MVPGNWEKSFLSQVDNPNEAEPYVYGQARFNFRVLLPAAGPQRVLELGSGLGLLTSELAIQAKSLVCLNPSYEALKFVQAKKMDKGQKTMGSINSLCISRLPFKAQSFDSVIASYGLEENNLYFLGEDKNQDLVTKSSHNTNLGSLLKDVYQLLKPGGRLVFPAQNKWDYENSIHNLKKKKISFRGHSLGEWKKMLKQAGFESLQCYGVYPNWQDPEELYSFSRAGLKNGWKLGAKEWLKQSSKFCSSFIIVADKKPGIAKSSQEAFLSELGNEGSSEADLFGGSRVLITGKDKWVGFVRYKDIAAVVKIPLEKMAREEEKANLEILQWASAQTKELSSLLPLPLANEKVGGLEHYLESQILGEPFSALVQNLGRPGAWKQVEKILDLFLECDNQEAKLEGELYKFWVEAKLETVAQVLPGKYSLEKFRNKFKELLWGKSLNLGLTHGDFSVSNLMARENREICGIFDWGWGKLNGICLVDSLNYLDSVERLQSKNHLIDNIRMLLKKKWRVEAEYQGALRHLEKSGWAESHWNSAILFFWLYTASARLADNFRYDQKGIQKQILDFVDEFDLA